MRLDRKPGIGVQHSRSSRGHPASGECRSSQWLGALDGNLRSVVIFGKRHVAIAAGSRVRTENDFGMQRPLTPKAHVHFNGTVEIELPLQGNHRDADWDRIFLASLEASSIDCVATIGREGGQLIFETAVAQALDCCEMVMSIAAAADAEWADQYTERLEQERLVRGQLDAWWRGRRGQA